MGDKKLLHVIAETEKQKEKENGSIPFRTRGIGSEFGKCFKCDHAQGLMGNISAFVDNREDGERIVEMFNNHGVYLDYRESEPNWIQVKILACTEHLPDLQLLNRAILTGMITPKIIEDAMCEIKLLELDITIRAGSVDEIIGLIPKVTGDFVKGNKEIGSWCSDTSNYEWKLIER